MKIYTKTGDSGSTSLFGGTRISKDDIQIEAYGSVDELNAHLGLLTVQITEAVWLQRLKDIQSYLFVIGSHLATSDKELKTKLPQLLGDNEKKLERYIDEMENQLQPLQNFVLPGGGLRSAQAHICRTVCRRAERRVVSLSHSNEADPLIIVYLNRLSDFFFVFSRYLSKIDHSSEEYWQS
ncbi:MAG: cob(I)yrinic acid a,c-diamide adenosyltransferase [Saprospiraceae bacterium]|nr:cob(I)yrinic acid a,c-diamide adenosyltransferase [Saprospiraceae bacterium]